MPTISFENVQQGQPIRIANSKAELGSVAFVLNREHLCFLAIEKAQKPGYEFSHMMALPGGMCRGSNRDEVSQITIDEEVRNSVTRRVRAETTLDLKSDSLTPMPISELPITSYTVKGEKKFVVIFPWIATIDSELTQVESEDHSVDRAIWQSVLNIPWERVSPANRLIIAAASWRYLNESQRIAAGLHLQDAKDFCTQATEESGIDQRMIKTAVPRENGAVP
jgi:hypothetical protein